MRNVDRLGTSAAAGGRLPPGIATAGSSMLMIRWLRRAAPWVAGLLATLSALPALAQDTAAAWPFMPLESDWRGPGFYLSPWKLGLCLALFLAWVWTTDWINAACEGHRLNHVRWNSIACGSFLGMLALVLLLPWFWVSFPLLIAAYAAPLTVFILHHNKQVGEQERVLTPRHLRYRASVLLAPLGIRIRADKPEKDSGGPDCKLTPRGVKDEAEINNRVQAYRKSRGAKAARDLVADGLSRRASAILLDLASQAATVRYEVDGVWIDGEALPRETADPLLESLKFVAGLNPQELAKRQEGQFAATFAKKLNAATITCQATPTGQRALVQFEAKQTKFETLEEIGMRPKMQEQLKELFARPEGIVLFSANEKGGLRTTTHVFLRGTDRFLREFLALENADKRYQDVENVNVTTYKVGAGDPPNQILTTLLRTEPNVVVIRDVLDGDMLNILSKVALKGIKSLVTIRAKDSAEALLRMLLLKPNVADFAKAIQVVVNQRLVRKLCEACKESYTPNPELLKQLNLPAGRVTTLFRPPAVKLSDPKQKKKPAVCAECGGVGYVGRTALFEMLVVDDTVRKVLVTAPQLDKVRKAARAAGMRSLQEEGVLLVAKGVTSVQELIRALK